jgi:hypothetical protein
VRRFTRTQLQFAHFVDQNAQGDQSMMMARPFVGARYYPHGRPQYLLRDDLQQLIESGADGLRPDAGGDKSLPLSIGDRIISDCGRLLQPSNAYAPPDIEISALYLQPGGSGHRAQAHRGADPEVERPAERHFRERLPPDVVGGYAPRLAPSTATTPLISMPQRRVPGLRT